MNISVVYTHKWKDYDGMAIKELLECRTKKDVGKSDVKSLQPPNDTDMCIKLPWFVGNLLLAQVGVCPPKGMTASAVNLCFGLNYGLINSTNFCMQQCTSIYDVIAVLQALLEIFVQILFFVRERRPITKRQQWWRRSLWVSGTVWWRITTRQSSSLVQRTDRAMSI